MTLYYYDQTSGYSSYEIDHWKIFLKNCYGQISAEHYYGTTDTDAISHCNYCDNVANSYYIPLNNANNIDCRD